MNLIEKLEKQLANAKKKVFAKETKNIKEAIKGKDFANAERLITELQHLIDLDRVLEPELSPVQFIQD